MPLPTPRPDPVTMITLPSTVVHRAQCRTCGSRYVRPSVGAMLQETVIVTGGGSGIGRATAQRAAREGAHVAVLDLHADNARSTADMIGDGGAARRTHATSRTTIKFATP